MSASYQVILGDLAAASATFETESGQVAGLQAALNPPMAGTGDSQLDTVLSALLMSVSALQSGFTRRLSAHSQELKQCHDNYVSTDADVERLFSAVLNEYQ